jgi:hypothetical protein
MAQLGLAHHIGGEDGREATFHCRMSWQPGRYDGPILNQKVFAVSAQQKVVIVTGPPTASTLHYSRPTESATTVP